MTSKMVGWKIQSDLTRVKTIQYFTIGQVLDCFYTSEEGGLDFQYAIFEAFGLKF
jgi:hypothetical protein